MLARRINQCLYVDSRARAAPNVLHLSIDTVGLFRLDGFGFERLADSSSFPGRLGVLPAVCRPECTTSVVGRRALHVLKNRKEEDDVERGDRG